ncbi:MAG: NTP transferase domain-containing protein [Acidobacteriota bacterium]|jgi:spore coat polysaccharide biosynthesis protein SpsF|nr:NTP transferase domain-containing protein [Acidobacteriota bacterium]
MLKQNPEPPPGGVMAFLQGRMGSNRLPGKTLMKIQGRSILERAIGRLQASPAVDAVVVLTTRKKEDDAIAAECERLGVPFYRGPEDDVLARFCEAAEVFKPEIIIRATADNPLIETGSMERIVTALRLSDMDYCVEKDLPYGAATEAVTATALARTRAVAREPRHLEHVTLYIKEHPDEFRVLLLDPPAALRRPDFRVTVDTPEDFAAMERLIGRFPETAPPRPLKDYFI